MHQRVLQANGVKLKEWKKAYFLIKEWSASLQLTPEDRARLRHAQDLLENPELTEKLSNAIGQPLKKSI